MPDLKNLFTTLRDACQKYFPEGDINPDVENRLQCAFDSPPVDDDARLREIHFMAEQLRRWFPNEVPKDEELRLADALDDALILYYSPRPQEPALLLN